MAKKVGPLFFKKVVQIVLLFLIFERSTSFANTIYKIKPFDTLSEVLQKYVSGKIYGNTGSLKKALALNPKVHNPNILLPGAKIVLPDGKQTLVKKMDVHVNRAPAENIPVSQEVSPVAQSSTQPVPLPAPQPSIPDDSNGRYGIISLTPGFSFFRIDATDPTTGGTAQILSNVNTDLNFSWKQVFSAATQTHLDFNYSRLSLSDPSPRTIAVSGDNVFGFNVGITHAITSRFRVFSSLGYKQELLLRSLSSDALTLDRLFVPFLSVGAGYDFFKAKPFTFGVDGEASYHAPTEGNGYKFKGGLSYLGRLRMNQDVKVIHGVLEGAVYYRLQNQNTSVANQRRTNIGATFGASWSFE